MLEQGLQSMLHSLMERIGTEANHIRLARVVVELLGELGVTVHSHVEDRRQRVALECLS